MIFLSNKLRAWFSIQKIQREPAPRKLRHISIRGWWLFLFLPALAIAQAPRGVAPEQIRQIDQQINTSRDRVLVPLPQPSDFDLRIIAPEKAAVPKAIEEIEFDVKGFQFEGMSYFSKEEGAVFFNPLVEKKIGISLIREAAASLEKKYRDRGFFLVRVFIPPQQVKDGIFTIRVVEGYVAHVFVEGGGDTLNDQVAAVAEKLTSLRPLGLASLERTLLLINDIPGVAGTAVLRQGAELGASDLLINITSLPATDTLSVNNTSSKSSGPNLLSYNKTINQPMGLPGGIALGATAGGGIFGGEGGFDKLQSATIRYSQLLGATDLLWSLGGLASRAHPGASLRVLDIRSETSSFSPRLRYPIQRSRSSSVYLDGGLSVNRSVTTLAGELLTIDKSSVAELTASWVLSGWMNGMQSLSGSVFKGTKAFGASKAGDTTSVRGFVPDFLKYTINYQRTQKLPDNFSLQVSGIAQYTKDKLLVGELSSFGGTSFGRGFDPAYITGDKGAGALVELRYYLPVEFGPSISKLQLYASIERGAARTVRAFDTSGAVLSEPLTRQISSRATGLRFQILRDSQIDIQIADPRRTLVGADVPSTPRILVSTIMKF